MKKMIFLFIVIFTLVVNAQSNLYEVVLEADLDLPSLQNFNMSSWLDRAVDWGATGINLRLLWNDFVPGDNSKWTELSTMLTLIRSKHCERDGNPLDIYIRISLSRFPNGVGVGNADYQRRYNNELYTNPYYGGAMLNYSSTNSKNAMNNFISDVITHLSVSGVPIKAVFVVLSADDESEYTWHYLPENKEASGYSDVEISRFRSFLMDNNYGISSLNNKWGSSFTSFNDINIKNYNWQSIEAQNINLISYPAGRKDWLDFKVQELNALLSGFYNIIHNSGYKYGLQFPPFYTNTSEYSGRYDPTPLLQNADIFIEDDTPHGSPNFEFNSNLMRSLAKYWTVHSPSKSLSSNRVKFGTETNWFRSIAISGADLSNYWSNQARTSKDHGGSVLFISHWGTTEFPDVAKNFSNGIYNSSTDPDLNYSSWRTTLRSMNDETTVAIDDTSFNPNNRMAHLSFTQGLYTKSAGVNYPYNFNFGYAINTIENLYPLAEFYYANDSYKSNSIYGGNKMLFADVLTDYMCENTSMNISPGNYLSWHGGIFFTADSYYISDAARNVLLNCSNYKDNATYIPNAGYAVTIGARNEYNQNRNSLLKSNSQQESETKNKLPVEFILEQNYPNPFNPSTLISYSVPAKDFITLKVFDLLGREVASLVGEMKEAGNYSAKFDGSKLSSGVYVYTLSSSRQQISKKLLLMK